MRIILFVLGLVAIAAAIIPILRFQQWYVRIFDFPRLQIAFLAAIVLVLFIYFCFDKAKTIDYVFSGALIIVLALEVLVILPYSPLFPKQVLYAKKHDDNRSISLMVTNVLMENRNYERCLKVINDADADVLLMVETDQAWQDAMKSLTEKYSYTHFCPLGNTYGMLLYSKLPLHGMKTKFLIQSDVPSFHGEVELPSRERVKLRFVHPTPPVPTENDSSTERDAELLLVGKEVEDIDTPVIVAGDLNDVAWSYTTSLFQKISGLLDPRKGRGLYSTFNAKYFLFRWPLDHIFHSNDFELVEMRRLEKTGSDHFPIFVKLQLSNEAPAEQEEPEATEDQEKDADEKIKKGQNGNTTQAETSS